MHAQEVDSKSTENSSKFTRMWKLDENNPARVQFESMNLTSLSVMCVGMHTGLHGIHTLGAGQIDEVQLGGARDFLAALGIHSMDRQIDQQQRVRARRGVIHLGGAHVAILET
jgi:hypothetical protein